MKKVITYGTYDLLHHGHVRLLERAKALGDYLVVGVTADSFDRVRGKINVSQTLNERMQAVRDLGIADEIIVEEYDGQKIDDIKRLDIDIFTVGSDWVGEFDYLKDYCEVVYLDRTEGISSSEIRAEQSALRLGFVGSNHIVDKYIAESSYVNGITASGVWRENAASSNVVLQEINFSHSTQIYETYAALLDSADAIYIVSHPARHYEQAKQALEAGKHVLCEAPVALTGEDCKELVGLAKSKNLIFTMGIKTAYSTAYHRLLLMAKSGRIGRVVSVDATCTSLQDLQQAGSDYADKWTASTAWGPAALLPILQLLGTKYKDLAMIKCAAESNPSFDVFGKIELIYSDAVGTATFGKAVKSEGSLIVSGTEGYIYVPAPWWKTDYFEIRKEDPSQNRRFYYQLDGEGIRNELVMFARAIEQNNSDSLLVASDTAQAVSCLMDQFINSGSCINIASFDDKILTCL